MNPYIKINKRKIGSGCPTYIVAEMSANHNRDFNQAVQILKAAKESGADAIKLQTYTPDTITIDCDKEYFLVKSPPWEGRNLYDLYGDAFMPWDWQPKLKEIAENLGLDFFSSTFDHSAVDFLEKMNVPAFKVASFEITDIPLLRKIAQTGKPIIMSTGMAKLAEIEEAVQAIRESGGKQLVLLKCTSAYPAPPEELNLRTIPHIAEAFSVPAGISDHTLGFEVVVAAVTLGACVVEKHFTLSRKFMGPDSSFSMEPAEFKEMVKAIRTVEKALGRVNYQITEGERANSLLRRSLFVVKDMRAGDMFTEENVRSIRPGYGLHPRHLGKVLGRRANLNLPKGTPLHWDVIKKTPSE